MVDLRNNIDRGVKKQRATHQDDATWDRLARAAALTGLTMSQVIDKLIWEELQLPGDPEQVAPDPAAEPELPLETPAGTRAPDDRGAGGIKGRPITEAELAQLEGRNIRDSDRGFDL